nr:immunoglobulin light chain junction region [Macaca mulatta]MOV78035.1 immunoglobulin light chain junction region [Macaca mulatta]MOV79483.1 immunoglobulin light chain junction region [Macaca mulatta]MOV80821.1 immunoglobulin light chain junction region [Macaca mulatta]MOV83110.1 immunoglobulin light chain junction region [Macaca mulatta]
CLQGYTIPYTF